MVLLCFPFCIGFAQEEGRVIYYSGENGPSHRSISSIVKDKDGFMWFGTWDGINRYDGTIFKKFDSFYVSNKFFLQSRRIVQIADGSDDRLWVLTYDKQVYWFDKRTEEFHPISPNMEQSLGGIYPVNKILAVEEGLVWLGTEQQGVIAFSCNEAEKGTAHYRQGNEQPYCIDSDRINILQRGSDGQVWIGTDKGLNLLHYVDGEYQVVRLPYQGNQRPILKAVEGRWGSAFMTDSAATLLVEKNKGRIERVAFASSKINHLLFSKYSDFLYATSDDGNLYSVDLSTKAVTKLVTHTQALLAMFEDSKGNLWIELDHGVLHLDREINLPTIFKPLYPQRSSTVLFHCFEDVNQRVWVSMKGGGFGYYDEEAREIKFAIDGSGNQVIDLPQYNNNFFYDSIGVAWFSSEEQGLAKLVFPNTNFRHRFLFLESNNVLNDEARSLMFDSKGRLWIGTKAGNLYIREGDAVSEPIFINKPIGGFGGIYSLLEDRSGNLWIGTKTGGLFKAVLEKDGTYVLKQYAKTNHELGGNQVYSLAQDKQQHVWIGTFDDGLYKMEEGFGKSRLKKVSWHDNVGSKRLFNKIRHIVFDAKGNLWIATTEGLVVHAPDGETCFFFDTPPDDIRLGDNDIQYIFSDPTGAMWLCTAGGGLTKVEGDPFATLNFKNFGRGDGLYNGFILSGIADLDGNLWLSTEGGLIKYNSKQEKFYNVEVNNSLEGLSFSEKTVSSGQGGHIFWGTRKGILEYHPEENTNKQHAVSLVFTKLLINNEEQNLVGEKQKINIQYAGGLILQHDQNNLSMDFAVTDFRLAQHHFVYRLLGLDSVWHQNGTLNRATFTNLKPGKYVLEVRSDHDFYKSAPFRQLSIVILPPWWKTWWAYLIYFALVVAVAIVVRNLVRSMWILKQRVSVERKLAEVKMRFFTNVSHELRTPLTLMLSPVEQLLKREPLSKEGRQYAQLIDKNAKRMQRFVDQLLELRQIQEHKYTLNKSLVDIVDLVKQVLGSFKVLAEEKNITVQENLPGEPLFLLIDRDNIEIVLYNLSSNAFKYAPPNSNIILNLTIDVFEETVMISVLDEGPGVREEALPEIFDLFHVEAISSEKTAKSSGIGLSLSKELVHLHGGDIWATNRDTGGLEVTFTLKLEKEISAIPKETLIPDAMDGSPEHIINEKQRASKDQSNSKKQVLLVEDNDELRTFLSSQLNDSYEVATAESGEVGVELAIKNLPDIIISDVMMPRLDGIELVRQLRDNKNTSHIPIILLSAKHAIETQIQGLEYGADYYITKPFRVDFLLTSVQSLLRQRKRLFERMLDRRDLLISSEDVVITDHDSQFLKDVISIVEEKMVDPDLNIDKIADALHMGRNTFYKKFKSLTNMAPVEFVRDLRLEKAKLMLGQRLDNVSEIAYRVGFNNPKYFSTCFKEKFGISPKAYFQQEQNN